MNAALVTLVAAAIPITASPGWHLSFTDASHRLAEPIRLPDGTALLCGGDDRSCERFHQDAGRWLPEPPLGEPRRAQALVLLADGSVVATGGLAPDGTPLASAERRDPASGRWTAIPPMREPRASHRALSLPDGRVLVVSGAGDRCALETWHPGDQRWTLLSCPDPKFVPGQAVVLGGAVLFVGPTVGAPGLRLRIWKPASGAWSEGPSIASNPYHFRLQPWSPEAALLLHSPSQSPWQATLFDDGGRVVRTGNAPRSGSDGPPKLVRLASGRAFALVDGVAWLSDALFARPHQIDRLVGRGVNGTLTALGGDAVLVLGALGDPRLSEVWSETAMGNPCRDLESFFLGVRVPETYLRSGDGREYLDQWLATIEQLSTPACRQAAQRGATPALVRRLYALLSTAGTPDAGFVFERSLGRFGVCVLGLPWMATRMHGWFRDRPRDETRFDREMRGFCLAALAENAPRAVEPLLAISLRKEYRWELDAAVPVAAKRSPALRRQLGPLLRAAHEKRASGYLDLFSAACLPPDPPALAPICRRATPSLEHEERVVGKGGARLLLESRFDRPAHTRSAGLGAAFDLRGFVHGRYAGAFNWQLGGTRRGFSYEVNLFPLGLGMFPGGKTTFGLFLGAGVSGVTGEVPFAFQIPAELFFDFPVGERVRVMSWARAGWMLTRARRGGAASAPFTDEVTAGLRLRVGRSFVSGSNWFGRGAYLGAAWGEAMHTTTLSLLFGYEVDMAGSF